MYEYKKREKPEINQVSLKFLPLPCQISVFKLLPYHALASEHKGLGHFSHWPARRDFVPCCRTIASLRLLPRRRKCSPGALSSASLPPCSNPFD